jgi:hypothetical protein
MSPQELAWAAGLFEGEGTIRINRPTRRNLGTLVVSVVNTDRQVVDFFQARWPGYMKPATGLGPNARPAWVWVSAAREASGFLRQVLPYLRRDRVRERAWSGLAFQDHKRSDRSNRTEAYREEDFNAYLWMRELNARGVSS